MFKRSLVGFFFLFLFFFLIFIVNNGSQQAYISYSFKIILILLSVACVSFLIIRSIFLPIDRSILVVLLSFSLYSILYCILSFNGLNVFTGLQRGFQVVSVLSVFYVFYFLGRKVNDDYFPYVILLLKFLFIFYFCISLVFAQYSNFDGGLLNPNGFGLWVGLFGLVLLQGWKDEGCIQKILLPVLTIYLIYISSSRTALAAYFLCFIVFLLPVRVLRNKFVSYSMLVIVLFSSFVLLYLYVNIDSTSSDVVAINELVRNYSGKNLLSGRNEIWPLLMEYAFYKPLLGWGAGMQVYDIVGVNLSAHNFYIQTFIQVGFVGIFFLLLIIFSIFNSILKIQNVLGFKGSLSVFLYILLVQNFEVTLLQNNLALSYPAWAFIGFMIGFDRCRV